MTTIAMNEAREVPCPHCAGTGKKTIPPGIETVEAYYFGCQRESGHYFFHPDGKGGRSWDIERRVGPAIYPRIDSRFCPGAKQERGGYRQTRPEVEGEAALNHIEGWTILSFWDRSVDKRGGCNSNFVALGTHDYTTMRAIAATQFPSVWKRFKFEVRLVEEDGSEQG